MNVSSSLRHYYSRSPSVTFCINNTRAVLTSAAAKSERQVFPIWGAASCSGKGLLGFLHQAPLPSSGRPYLGCKSSGQRMALHATASADVQAAASTAAEPVSADGQLVLDAPADQAESQKRPQLSQDRAPSPASTSEPQQPAKRRKPNVPPPTMVRKGATFAAGVWANAAVLVDKPKDWTSFDVCGKLRGALKTKKVGHAGTLDPMATGLLIICTGQGTKQIDNFVAMEKAYSGTLRLGQATPSYDAMSEIEEELPWEHITDEDLEAAKQAYVGDILQQPPMFSAIKIKGERLYNAARRGEVVERQSRPVTIHSFELRRDEGNKRDVHFRVSCSKGTYIRSLAHDLGKAVGSAAHLTALRRESIGEYDVADAWSVPDLVAAAHAARQA